MGKAQLTTLHLRMLREQRELGTGLVVPLLSPQASQASDASLASIRKPGTEWVGRMTTQALKRPSPHFRAETWTPYSEQVLCPFYFLSNSKWISVSKLVFTHDPSAYWRLIETNGRDHAWIILKEYHRNLLMIKL